MVAAPIRVHALIDGLAGGGAEMLLPELASAAPGAGIELAVTALSIRDGWAAGQRLEARGVRSSAVPIRSILDPRDVRRVRAEIARVGADVVHTHLGNADLVGGLAARTLGVPALSTIHADHWPADRRLRLKLDLMALARRRCHRVVLAVSESARRTYLAEGWDVPGRVRVVHNGVGTQPAPGAGAEVRRELGIDPAAFVVAMVTSLRPEKGFDVALQAVAALRKRHLGAHLLIAGAGPGREGVAQLAAAHPGTATLAGHRDDVMAVLDASDVVLQPSRYDAFPSSLLEAQAASVAVVATRVGGIPEIVEHGVSGLLVDPPPAPRGFAEALEALASDPGRRAALAAAGRSRYEQEFTAERWAARLRDVYEELLRAGDGRGPISSPR